MILKLYNQNIYTVINKNNYVNNKYYYEELLKTKFNKKYTNSSVVDEINLKIKTYIKNKV
jgi:hypothetical protein